jgi:gliding motility-associated-like protein
LKLLVLISGLLFNITLVFSQRQTSVWYFGTQVGLDFKQSPPQALYNAGLSSLEGCAAISDANGEILFYTNGVSVNNKMHRLMKNGTGLMGDLSSTNNAVIVPFPGRNNIYYLFTVGAQNQPGKGFRYSIIDMNGDNGLGEVKEKNILIEDRAFEKLAAIHHCNKSDVWVTIRKWGTDEYHTYLVTNSGISASPLISNASYTATNPIGSLKFSANGKRLAAVYSYENNEIELMDFDNTSGMLTNPVHFQPEAGLPDPDIGDSRSYGAEFSPNGNILYISSNNSNTGPSTIYQFDITSGNVSTILASKQIITQIYPWVAGALQIGPDQKIYMAMGRDTAISVIENPDLLGPACNFQFNRISLKGNGSSFVQYGLPNFIQSYFDPKSFYDFARTGNCFDRQVKFELNKQTGIDSLKWDFGDGQYSTQLNPVHNYVNAGYYTVNLIVYKIDCSGSLFEAISHKIWIAESKDFLGADKGTCSLSSYEIGVDEISEANYLWNTGEGTNKINTQGFGSYWLKIGQNGCTISDTFNLFEKPKPVAKITGNDKVCLNKGIVLKAADPSVVSYLWNTGEITPNISVISAGTYSVQVTGNSCVAYDTVIVQWGGCDAFIPTAFTPNNDRINDDFGVASGFAANDFHMQIFDRWGKTVFITANNTNKWDGTHKGKAMPNGAYTWYMSYTDSKSRKIFLQGTVLLIR